MIEFLQSENMNIKLPKRNLVDKLPISSKQKKILVRRINKFKKDPLVFIEDSYNKRSAQIHKYVSKKEVATEVYSIVVAVWNSEPYLNDFFKSLIKQNIDFKKHIQVILVDDGSTDQSSNIIKSWQKRYPKNIHYYYKNNGGQSSARNLGLEYVNTKWVTFIDPDDFVGFDFFYQIEKCISKEGDLDLVVANIIRYDDEYNSYSDSHPLKKRFAFKGANKIIEVKNQGADILTSVCGVFIQKSLLDKDRTELRFNENLKVIFEDTHFINKYVLFNSKGKIGFVKNAKYYHRSTAAHTIDSVWEEASNFGTTISESLLDLCQVSLMKLNYVPVSIQMAVLYHVTWIVSKIVDNDLAVGFLEESQKQRFLALLDEVFYYIDEDCIFNYGYSKALFANKIGLLNVFKNKAIKAELQRAYIDSYNHNKKLFRVRYFSDSRDDLISFQFDGEDVVASHMKVLQHDLLDRVFNFEYILWVKIPEKHNVLKLFINNNQSMIHLGARRFKNLGKKNIFNFFEDSGETIPLSKQTWFFIDSDLKADDNAEHLYRYVMNETKMRKDQLLFGLNATSHDWSRLKAEGFNLVDMQSFESNIALRSSNKILSSNASDYIMHFDGRKSLLNKNFIFLQHGVIHNDLSKWLKAKNFDFFLTSTIDEYNSIAGDISNYFFTDREVKLTGQPRYDSLLAGNDTQKQILIMPTWRKDIVGKLVSGKTAEREFNPNFMQTEYAQKWQSFLNNEKLKQLSLEYDYKIIYFPHANVQIYSHLFDIPEYVDVITHDVGSIQPLFQKSALMITDYSSVAFEMAFLNKQVIYYQFDEEKFLSGAHTSKPNYFIYREHGFGPVVTTEQDLVSSLESVLKNEGKPLEPYAHRIQETFAYRDTNNCERVYQAIIALDEPEVKELNVNLLYDMTVSANDNEVWDLAESRSLLLIEHGDEAQIGEAQEVLNKALFNQNKFTELFAALESDNSSQDEINYWKAKVAYATTNWQKVIKLLSSMTALDEEFKFMLLFSYAKTGKVAEFEKLKKEVQEGQLNEAQYLIIQAWSLRLYKQWQAIIDLLKNELSKFDLEQLTEYQPENLMAQAYRHLSDFEQAHQQLANFERHTKNNPRCRIEIARLAYSRDNYDKCIAQYNATVNGDIGILPQTEIQKYVLSLWGMGNFDSLMELLPEMISMYPHNDEFRLTYVRVLAQRSQWQELLEQASTLGQESKEKLIYPLTLARYRLGLIDEAYNNAVKPTIEHAYEYWHLVAEISLLVEDTDLAKYCYKGMIAIYPACDNSENWSRFDSLKG